MKFITSLINPEIKLVVALHNAQDRKKHQQFLAEGSRTISTFIEAGWQLEALYLTQDAQEKNRVLAEQREHTIVSDAVMKKMSTSTTPSGILARITIREHDTHQPLKPGLVLARIQDPGNMGTLIRTAAALALENIIIIEGCDPYSPKVVQASAGALATVPLVKISWQDFMEKKKNIPLYALMVRDGKSPEHINLPQGFLVVGNEAQGIPHEWLKDCNEFLTLDMPGQIESLNAAVAGSIALYIRYQQHASTHVPI